MFYTLIVLLAFRVVSAEENFPHSICATWDLTTHCVGGDSALISTDVRLTYSYKESGITRSRSGPNIVKHNETGKVYHLRVPGGSNNSVTSAEFYFEQLEHGGGDCNCVQIYFNCSDANNFCLCGGSASLPRRKHVTWTGNGRVEVIPEISIPRKESPLLLNTWNESSYIEVSFDINFKCGDGIDVFDEGVEFSTRLCSSPHEWIPIRFLYTNSRNEAAIDIGEPGENFTIRGYRVEQLKYKKRMVRVNVSNHNSSDSIQFRWMQTSRFNTDKLRDLWTLDNIGINFVSGGISTGLLHDNFENGSLNTNLWPEDHVRNGQVAEICGRTYNIEFGLNSDHSHLFEIHSRALLTKVFSLSKLTQEHYVSPQSSCPLPIPNLPLDANQTSYTTATSVIYTSTSSSFFRGTVSNSVQSLSPSATISPVLSLNHSVGSNLTDNTSITVVSTRLLSTSSSFSIHKSLHSSPSATVSPSPTPSHSVGSTLTKNTLTYSTSALSTDSLSSFSIHTNSKDLQSSSPTATISPLPTPNHPVGTNLTSILISSTSIALTDLNGIHSLSNSLQSLLPTEAISPLPTPNQPVYSTLTYTTSTSSNSVMSTYLFSTSSSFSFHTSSFRLHSTATHFPVHEVTDLNPFNSNDETQLDANFLLSEDEKIKEMLQGMSSTTLNEILTSKNTTRRVTLLLNESTALTTDAIVLAYLFSAVSESVNSATSAEFTLKTMLGIANILLIEEYMNTYQYSLTVGSTLIASIDTMLHMLDSLTGMINNGNISLQFVTINLNHTQDYEVTAINSSSIPGFQGLEIALTVPLELLTAFPIADGQARIVSVIYRNMESLFSGNGSVVASDTVGTSIQCSSRRCPSNNFTLQSSNVTVTFDHSAATKKKLEAGEMETKCVFLDLREDLNTTLSIGRWSDRGCTRNTSLSSTSRTVCDCNHLTNFVILLSPRPPEFSAGVALSLSVIGTVGVAISVVAMALTVVVFTRTFFKRNTRPLLLIRNYIHIHLCISLSVAQILFVSGIDKTGDPDGDVPIYCQVIAVLLHYFFLVSFMWMLMEGGVLYLALVKVFVSYHKRYMLFFTVTSYGLPLLYMGSLTLPLGFTMDGYGNKQTCFFNSANNFIWAFIAPTLLIFLFNFGFFIMAACISWHQHRRRVDNNKKAKLFWSWLKSAIPLVVVLGLTWITGVLVVAVEALYPLAYIYTIMVAFQGLFIFLVLVVFAKGVREEYVKCFKSKIKKKKENSHTISFEIKNPSTKADHYQRTNV